MILVWNNINTKEKAIKIQFLRIFYLKILFVYKILSK